MKKVVSCEMGGHTLSLETGELAKQAAGAVLVRYADTVVFVAAQDGPPRRGIDFFPLTVDYRERFAAAGKFPGGFLKREGRPTTREILTARLTDRPIRPMFPKGYNDEIQVMANVLAVDPEHDPDVHAIIGASAALMIAASIPFQGPLAAVRVGKVDGQLVIFPTLEQTAEGTLDLIVAGNLESVLMMEGFAKQMPEDEMLEAILFAQKHIVSICELQMQLVAELGVVKAEYEGAGENPLIGSMKSDGFDRLKAAMQSTVKAERHEQTKALKDELLEKHFPDDAEESADGATRGDFKEAFHDLEQLVVRDLILNDKIRMDGRSMGDLREISCSVDLLPRVHGSAVFTRGETQSICTITLGTPRDTQRIDGPVEEYEKRFMLDYNFPPYSVGECRMIRGPGRREIGHGALAERSVASILPDAEAFPYTIRAISDITESNGSSSMASVCSTTLGLMAAGVPILQPVAGISIGVIADPDGRFELLTDILGDEDHFGDMDFKIAGSQIGITGIQLDLKVKGISEEIIKATLAQAKEARLNILRSMLGTLGAPRADISEFAPRLERTQIDPEKIGLLIGPGGKTIRAIQDETSTQIDIQEDGTVTVSSTDGAAAQAALARIEALTEDVKVGRIYSGTVSSVKDFGVFIEIAPGKDGLCHISELADGFVKSVSDVCKVGDRMEVKVIAVDDQNRVKLSRRAVLADAAGGDEPSEDGGDDAAEPAGDVAGDAPGDAGGQEGGDDDGGNSSQE